MLQPRANAQRVEDANARKCHRQLAALKVLYTDRTAARRRLRWSGSDPPLVLGQSIQLSLCRLWLSRNNVADALTERKQLLVRHAIDVIVLAHSRRTGTVTSPSKR